MKNRILDGMEDDLDAIYKKPSNPQTPEDQRAAVNQDKNKARAKRGYKGIKGRMKSLACDSCDWRVRGSQLRIDQASGKPCPSCERGKLFQGD